MAMKDTLRPLTDIERTIAEVHHDFIYMILHQFHKDIDEYYGIASIGYLRGVQDWLNKEELHRYPLYTICKYRIWRELAHDLRDSNRMCRKPEGGIVSLDYRFDSKDGIGKCIAEIVDDGVRFEDNICEYDSMIEILSLLTRRQRHIALMRMNGYKNTEIADRLNLSSRTISVELKNMREIIKASRM